MAKEFKVPFNDKGQVTSQDYWQHVTELKDNYEFFERMTYVGYVAGRSSAIITWSGSDGKTYQSGMKFLNDVLSGQLSDKVSGQNFDISDRLIVRGKFTFQKQGTSVLLTLAKP